ncbi:hypothetical protein ZIOFF_031044 [Zingiber officinale]|uniref:Uncharacterized protein n=1 Tax=Zingiber officinale TaxID=94328 RepID=A0A8J5L5E6_ZINOF|nr:hypothetical protein ZIOFF_031044 [Zingiber officinale]
MSFRSIASLSLLLPLLFLLHFSSAAAGDDNLTAYQVLASYDFPPGLLPLGALGYNLDATTGAFSAYLNGSCSFSLEGSYQLHYKSTVTGVISTGRLSDLHGVSVKVLLFWVNIIEVRRLTDSLRFSVGIASADFAISNFYISPRCGCGLNCTDGDDSQESIRSPLRLPGRHQDAISSAKFILPNSMVMFLMIWPVHHINPTKVAKLSFGQVE